MITPILRTIPSSLKHSLQSRHKAFNSDIACVKLSTLKSSNQYSSLSKNILIFSPLSKKKQHYYQAVSHGKVQFGEVSGRSLGSYPVKCRNDFAQDLEIASFIYLYRLHCIIFRLQNDSLVFAVEPFHRGFVAQ